MRSTVAALDTPSGSVEDKYDMISLDLLQSHRFGLGIIVDTQLAL